MKTSLIVRFRLTTCNKYNTVMMKMMIIMMILMMTAMLCRYALCTRGSGGQGCLDWEKGIDKEVATFLDKMQIIMMVVMMQIMMMMLMVMTMVIMMISKGEKAAGWDGGM